MKRILQILLYMAAVALATMFFASNPTFKYPIIDNSSLFTNEEKYDDHICAIVENRTLAFFSSKTFERLYDVANGGAGEFRAICQFCEASGNRLTTRNVLFRKVNQDVYIDRYKLTEKELARLKLSTEWGLFYKSQARKALGAIEETTAISLGKMQFLVIDAPTKYGHSRAVVIDVARDKVVTQFQLNGYWLKPLATKIDEGRVLLYGGARNNGGTFEVVDPVKQFSYLLECHLAPQLQNATLCTNFNGQVLVIGGRPSPTAWRDATQVSEVEIGQQKLRKMPPLRVGRIFEKKYTCPPSAVLVTPATMIVTGGWKKKDSIWGPTGQEASHSFEIYDHLFD